MNEIVYYCPELAKVLVVEPSTCFLFVGLLIALMNLGGRLMPDDATGWLGFVRKMCKLVGLYASNRITSKLTVNKIAETTVPIVNELGEQIERVKAFPGLPERGADGKFKQKELGDDEAS